MAMPGAKPGQRTCMQFPLEPGAAQTADPAQSADPTQCRPNPVRWVLQTNTGSLCSSVGSWKGGTPQPACMPGVGGSPRVCRGEGYSSKRWAENKTLCSPLALKKCLSHHLTSRRVLSLLTERMYTKTLEAFLFPKWLLNLFAWSIMVLAKIS